MTQEKIDSIKEACRLIQQDVEIDMANLDGRVFSGANVGESLGNLYAIVNALVKMILLFVEEVECQDGG